MMPKLSDGEKATLLLLQEATQILLTWAEADFPSEWQYEEPQTETNITKAILIAKELLQWSDKNHPQALRLLFDRIHLSTEQEQNYYWTPQKINNNDEEKPLIISYPKANEPTEQEFLTFKASIRQDINKLNLKQQDWQNLSLLILILEKYGSYISFGNEDIALIDIVLSTVAVAAAIANKPDTQDLSLIAGDLSGIQKFIYTISSDGALKSLRARSFYLELVTEEVVQQLLEALELPRTNVIYAGGGNLYILAPTEITNTVIQDKREQLNNWLWDEFQGKVFLALDFHTFSIDSLQNQKFAEEWTEATKKLALLKSQKFSSQIHKLLHQQSAHEPCKVCHRDDVENLQPLNRQEINSPLSCSTCRKMFELGTDLLKVAAIVRSKTPLANKEPTISFNIGKFNDSEENNICYYLFQEWKLIFPQSQTVLLVNDWNIEHYKFAHFSNPLPLLLGNYGKKTQIPEEKGPITASEMAEIAQGISRVGYLRMDVDNLGQIFARGLGENQTLPRLAGLSRQISYFFKAYLTSLALDRDRNIPNFQDEKYQKVELNNHQQTQDRSNLLFIYAGGDDLFVSGAWNEIVEFGFDVYQCFRAYTGYNPDITLSAGISLAVPKFPLYQAADESGDAEAAAKGNGRDSLTLFGQTFKWDEWLGSKNLSRSTVEAKDREYWDAITLKPQQPELLGVLPIVKRLNSQEIGKDYARNFVRNLINVSNLQEQKLREIENQQKTLSYDKEDKDIKYYLHLPQIAYTLARLPRNVLEDDDFRKALKNPYNAPYYRVIATWIELLNR